MMYVINKSADWPPNYYKQPEYFPQSDGRTKSVNKLTPKEPAIPIETKQ